MASGSEKKKDKTKIKSNTPAKERGKRMKRANQKTKDFIERQNEEGESKDKRLYRKAKTKDGR